MNSITLKNIDLTDITLITELSKHNEELKEFKNALAIYFRNKTEINREYLKEEACDVIQVILSILKILDIDIPEISEYWNSKHLEKLKSRPRKEN